jgi:hypothetical protein
LLACVATFALAACGDDTFTAADLVAELNEHGAALELGEALPTSREGIEIYSLEFAQHELGEHGGHGSLTITPDDESGLAEYERCRAGGLVCFRAANAVLLFEDEVEPADRARLEAALGALESG